MRSRVKDPAARQENGTPQPGELIPVLERKLEERSAELLRRSKELQESIEGQTATAEVLKVISRSSFELQPVLQTLAESAARLCGAGYGAIFRRDGEVYRIAAVVAFSPEMERAAQAFQTFLETHPFVPGRGSITGRVALERRAVQVADTAADPEYTVTEATTLAKLRTQLGVPLLRDGSPIGVIVVGRQHVDSFTQRQVELVTTFADQAVIAIENVRIFKELQARSRELTESLQQQTATADVLKVISRSTFDLQLVLGTLARSAAKLCDADKACINQRDGELYRLAVNFGFSDEFEQYARENPIPAGLGTITGRAALQRKAVHLPDVLSDSQYTASGYQSLGHYRTGLGVPLLRDGEAIGVFTLTRSEVKAFSDSQIELVTTFADQAVIAIENARLLNELRERTRDLQESLEYQSATSEVLKVISRSTFDLHPVLQSVLETAARLCDAEMAFILRRDGEVYRAALAVGFSPEYQAFMNAHPISPSRGTVTGRAVLERRAVHIDDVANDPEYTLIEAIEIGRQRTALGVPLLRESEPIGVIVLSRRRVEPFSTKQIELVTTFADQAVIAIENVRLFDELRKRTEELAQRQAELRVTFDNMGDGVVMFDEELRLAAWNRNLQQLLDLPDSFFARLPRYADYIRYLVERGEFGDVDVDKELKRYTETAGRQSTVERTRPDGRVLEVRHNPVGDGGFVLIYSDVTERKHAEAKIRSARDAAEAALRDLKALQTKLIHAEKMASLGQLTAGIAHEIKNPLNFVNNFAYLSTELAAELAETLQKISLDESVRSGVLETIGILIGNLEKISQHGRRADSIVRNMLLHSREGSGDRRRIAINPLVEESLNLAYHGARAEKPDFEVRLENTLDSNAGEAYLYPQEITRVLLNLISNGFYATSERKRDGGDADFLPTIAMSTRNVGDSIEIRIRDNGIGIPDDIRAKMFDPFYTTKPTGEGTGLGLSISHDIVVKQHGGQIEVLTQPGVYTEFIITLPRSGPAISPE